MSESTKAFYDLVKYYNQEFKEGNYHNPYDVREAIESLIPKDIDEFMKVDLEDIAHSTGDLFWSM